jgi:hypothetical protein
LFGIQEPYTSLLCRIELKYNGKPLLEKKISLFKTKQELGSRTFVNLSDLMKMVSES